MLKLSLPRKSVVRETDRPDMTSAVYLGHKASNQANISFLSRLDKGGI